MAHDALFLDTGGFYALLVSDAQAHDLAAGIMQEARRVRRPMITTDYVLQETATLLVARRRRRFLTPLFAMMERSAALTIEWITPQRFTIAQRFLLKHREHDFSFTDCVSFAVMRECRLREALATDDHFRTAGFRPLLAEE